MHAAREKGAVNQGLVPMDGCRQAKKMIWSREGTSRRGSAALRRPKLKCPHTTACSEYSLTYLVTDHVDARAFVGILCIKGLGRIRYHSLQLSNTPTLIVEKPAYEQHCTASHYHLPAPRSPQLAPEVLAGKAGT